MNTRNSNDKNLPQFLKEKIIEKQSRFNGLELSESDIEEIIKSAANNYELDLDMSGAALGTDGGLFLADSISRHNFFSFININLSNAKLTQESLEALMYIIIEFKHLETLIIKNNDLNKESGISIAKVLGN